MKMISFSFRSSQASLETALFSVGLQLVFLMFPLGSLRAGGENLGGTTFNWKNLQSDIDGVADRTDPNLVNSWGLAINPNSNIFWVADNGTGVSTLYRPDGTPFPVGNPLVVTIPPTSADTEPPIHSAPTGIVFNPFAKLFKGAIFIFDGEDGSVAAWSGGASAVIEVDNSASGAVYKGLALAVRPNVVPTLYATNFHSGHVDIFDSQFGPVTIAGSFVDPNPPPVPTGASGWGPFNIAAIDNHIYVTFAAQDADKHDDVRGPGNGFVDVFNTQGAFIKRLITGGNLNSPWGLAKVPFSGFGGLGPHVLLVGNFGDGFINAFQIQSGEFRGQLLHRKDQPLAFNGLWSLFFFNGRLYFTAGIADEADGLFGFIRPVEEGDHDDQ